MNSHRASGPQQRAQRVAAVVCLRGEETAEQPATRRDYLALATQLPHLVRHNGLAHTLSYLQMLAAPAGRNNPAAQMLLDDWWSPVGTANAGLHLALLGETPAAPSNGADYRLASRLALAEAALFKRFAQVQLASSAMPGPEGRTP